ncbi:hypothetical protein F1559_002016 [Cyanidiococcus yangmingshanensis]|uniref:Uncharacterized protein n=1 Tax=Cyanidiococcus yangmingshanensis TaxID=2690220 RepID=A0A7J7IF12_9RHOD|nr:hypothetical protein F1559_002016 [Cyanidiococcus yangmingshanensis]
MEPVDHKRSFKSLRCKRIVDHGARRGDSSRPSHRLRLGGCRPVTRPATCCWHARHRTFHGQRARVANALPMWWRERTPRNGSCRLVERAIDLPKIADATTEAM